MTNNVSNSLPANLAALPPNWKYAVLGDLVDARRGISYGIVQPGDHGIDGIPVLRAGNIENGKIILDDVINVIPEIENKYKRTRLIGGEVLLTLVGAFLGKAVVAPSSLVGWNVARAIAVIPVLPEIDPHWIELCLRSETIQTFISNWANTTAQPTLNLGDVAKLPIPLPPQEERDAITKIFRALDDKIELNHRMNATLEEIDRTLFKSWFVDFDPVRAKMEGRQPEGIDAEMAALFPDRLVDSELGLIPEGWNLCPLIERAQYVNGAAYKNIQFSSDQTGRPVVKIAEIKNGFTKQTQFTHQKLDDKYHIDSGDILFSWSGSPDTSIDTFIWADGAAWLNQHIFKVIPYNSYERAFVYLLLRNLNPIFIEIARDKQTTGLGHVTRNDMSRINTVVPSTSLMLAFENMAGEILNRIFANELESRTLAIIRDTLLPKLLSGEVRIEG